VNKSDIDHLHAAAANLGNKAGLRSAAVTAIDDEWFLVDLTKESGGPTPLSLKFPVKFTDRGNGEKTIAWYIEYAKDAGRAR
jgi:hypothetical protein